LLSLSRILFLTQTRFSDSSIAFAIDRYIVILDGGVFSDLVELVCVSSAFLEPALKP
jgi:hypothetical protein